MLSRGLVLGEGDECLLLWYLQDIVLKRDFSELQERPKQCVWDIFCIENAWVGGSLLDLVPHVPVSRTFFFMMTDREL